MKRGFLLIGMFLLFVNFFVNAGIEVYFDNEMALGARKAINKLGKEKKIKNPQVIVWGSGPNGLTQRCLQFYLRNVLKPLSNNFSETYKCFFYDLAAWEGLYNESIDLLTKRFALNEELEEWMQNQEFNFEVIPSSLFFQYFFELENDQIIDYIQDEILKRVFIWDISSQRNKKSGIIFKDTILSKIVVFQSCLDVDTGLIYSALQYLEGIFLTVELIKRSLDAGLFDINILFFLPKGELEYYYDKKSEENFFEMDLNVIIKKEFSEVDFDNVDVSINFKQFKYSANGYTRPYLFIKGDTLIEAIEQIKEIE